MQRIFGTTGGSVNLASYARRVNTRLLRLDNYRFIDDFYNARKDERGIYSCDRVFLSIELTIS